MSGAAPSEPSVPQSPVPAASRPPVAVVCGAGPAGILSSVFLAKRGFEVHVYERRPSPLLADASDRHRAFVMVLHRRGRGALEAAGFDVPALAARSGLQWASSVDVGSASRLDALHTPLGAQPLLVGSRHAFVCAMLEQAEDMDLPIHWHWQTSFEAADLQARTAVFCGHDSLRCRGPAPCCTARPSQRSYDLLVGADGGWSRVRRAAEAQVPGLASSAQPSSARYKVFTGLPPAPGVTADTLRVLPAAGAAGRRHKALAFLVTDSASGTTRGMLSMEGDGWHALQGAPCCLRFLEQEFPALPREWLPELASQLAVRPQVVAGTRVSVTQLHGPALVLLGDAGHAVTPRTGHGFNAALEDAWLLARVLDETGANLEAAPRRFNEARLPDAAALLWLDADAATRGASSVWGRLRPAAVLRGASMAGRGALSRATGGWVRPASQQLMNEGGASYSAVKSQIQRDQVLLATIGAPLTVAVALASAVSVVAARLRKNSQLPV